MFTEKNSKLNNPADKISQGIIFVSAIFFITRIAIVFIAYLSNLIIKKGDFISGFIGEPYNSNIFFKWDSGWYYELITKGYMPKSEGYSNVGFMPFYPLLVKIISWPFGHPIITGLIISNLAILLAGIYLYKLIKLDFDSEIAEKSILFMFIMPVSFFFSIFYTEGLFMFLTVSSFYYARKKQWILASLLAGLSAITRPFGLLIALSILIEYQDIENKSLKSSIKTIKKDILAILLVPLPFIIFIIYQFFKFGDAMAYFHAQKTGWGRGLTLLKPFTEGYFFNHPLFYQILILGAAAITLILLIHMCYIKQRISYIVYASLTAGLYWITSINEGAIPRYMMVIFPLYISLAIITSKNKFLNYLVEFISLALLTLLTIMFVNGYWMV